MLTATHSGESDFSVSIVGEDRDEGLSIKTVGAYAGVRGHSVHSGDSIGVIPGLHTLRILADGSWTINIGQEFPLNDTDGTAPPLRLTEQRGDDVLRWVIFAEGVYGIQASHQGAGRFVVELINADGASEILVVNETGNHEGERVLRVGPDSSTSDLAPVSTRSWSRRAGTGKSILKANPKRQLEYVGTTNLAGAMTLKMGLATGLANPDES